MARTRGAASAPAATAAKASKAPEAPKAPEELRRRAAAVDDELSRHYPDARCALVHDGPFQLLVATVLSAQTTDARVNTITPELFGRWPDPAALAGADRAELEALLRPLGMQRTRAERLIGLGAALADRGGQVPSDVETLQTLPGVGRKTANVVLGNAFGVPAITVDTHVGRLSRRLGWTTASDPRAVERDIASLWEPWRWTDGCHRLIEHGRAVCRARSPLCEDCALATGLCPRVGVA
ncbi:endonuclease III [Actinomyces howellii]|uniref:Endonuclease III n=1 Tax=Actinomyces howellii TaxID=52771 RepID=A0A448HIA9_9ACTO|nr:endonuclease III [Actinomyces howellii]VEG29148.1 UV-endonuclease [Actinomyces howellii]